MGCQMGLDDELENRGMDGWGIKKEEWYGGMQSLKMGGTGGGTQFQGNGNTWGSIPANGPLVGTGLVVRAAAVVDVLEVRSPEAGNDA